ncbi:hypothetical protein BGZ58_006260, partial [Dissophora ornata]
KWTYETVTHETFEEVEEVEEVVDEKEAVVIIGRDHSTIPAIQEKIDEEVKSKDTIVTSTLESVTVEDIVEKTVETTAITAAPSDLPEVVVVTKSGEAVSKGPSWLSRVISGAETAAGAAAGAVASGAGHVAHGVGSAAGAVASGAGHVAHGAEYAVGAVALGAGVAVVGAGLAAAGAIHKIDGVWKRTVKVITTRKAHVDE